MRIPAFNKKQKELLADLWNLDEYERKEIAMFLIASTLIMVCNAPYKLCLEHYNPVLI